MTGHDPVAGHLYGGLLHHEQLKRGEDPRPWTPEMAAHMRLLERELTALPGMEADVARWVERFENDPEARLRKRLADGAGIAYSVAVSRWSNPQDLAAELASQMIEVDDRVERHGPCGTRPDEVLDMDDPNNIRPLDHPIWKLYKTDCWTCSELAQLNKELTESEREAGTTWEVRPASEGDPWIDG